MKKKVGISYDYIVNCYVEIEVDHDLDVYDEDNFDESDLPEDDITIIINGENQDCDFLGIREIVEL